MNLGNTGVSIVLTCALAATALAAPVVPPPDVSALPGQYAEEFRELDYKLTESATCGLVEAIVAAKARMPAEVRDQARGMRKGPCKIPVSGMGAAEAEKALGARNFTFSISRDIISIYARSKDEEVNLCCSLQGPMTKIAPGLWAARWRLPQVDRALLSLAPFPEEQIPYRGPAAPSEPRIKKNFMATGKYAEVSLFSEALGETRKVEVYMPMGDWANCRLPVLVIADGLNFFPAMLDTLIEEGKVGPIMLVGLPSGQRGIVEDRSSLKVDIRAADYLPGFEGGGDRFRQHMDFATRQVPKYMAAHYPVRPVGADWAVTGSSNGGVFAFNAGYLHPEIFGTAIPMSAGWWPLGPIKPTPVKARFFASAGLYEARFMFRTRQSAEALAKSGYKVEMTEYAAGHMRDQWIQAAAKTLPKVFPAARAAREGNNAECGRI